MQLFSVLGSDLQAFFCVDPVSPLTVDCSGSMIRDTNVGGNIATISEVSDVQKATIFFS